MIDIDDFDTIIKFHKDIDKGKLLSVFLYIRSYIIKRPLDDFGNEYPDAKDKPEAFWRPIEQIVDDLKLSTNLVNKCLNELLHMDLLKKHKTGSYQKNKKPRKNAPNIYVLNNDKWEQEQGWALKKLEEIFEVEHFDPPIQRHKKKNKDNKKGEDDETN